MNYRRNISNDSSDSEEFKLNLDKDDEDFEFQEEKEIDDDDDEEDEDVEIKNVKLKNKPPLFPTYNVQSKNNLPLVRKHARKISFKSSSSSSDELNKKIKRDLHETLNKKLTNFEKAQSKSQKEIFEKNFNILKDDFKIIEEYEKIILKDTSIDIMFCFR